MIEDIFDGGHLRASRQVEALGWRDLAVPAAGLALTAPFAAPAQGGGYAQPRGHPPPVTQRAPKPARPAPGVKAPAAKPQATKEQSWQAMTQAASSIAGRPVTFQLKSALEMRDVVGYANAYVQLDGTANIYLGPTVAGYLDYPNTGTYVQGVAEVIHEAVHLKFFFEDGNYTRAVDERLTNQTAIAIAPQVIDQFFPWLKGDPTIAYSINRALIQLTPEQYH